MRLIHADSFSINKSELRVLFRAVKTVTECSLQKCETVSEPNTLTHQSVLESVAQLLELLLWQQMLCMPVLFFHGLQRVVRKMGF